MRSGGKFRLAAPGPAVLVMLVLACGYFPTDPGEPAVNFIIQGGQVLDPVREQALMKTVSIDRARVLIGDLRQFASEDEYWNSDLYWSIGEAWQNPEGLETWTAWKNFLTAQGVRIFSEQILVMDGEYAYGRVAGVVGLNFILLVFEEGGLITDLGMEAHWGNADSTQVVQLDVRPWHYY